MIENMINLLIRLLVIAGALLLVSRVVPGITIESVPYALLVALVLALLNISVRPVLVFLTLPATILTLGLFIFVINACMFMLADYLLIGFAVEGFMQALIGSILVSITSTLLYKLLT